MILSPTLLPYLLPKRGDAGDRNLLGERPGDPSGVESLRPSLECGLPGSGLLGRSWQLTRVHVGVRARGRLVVEELLSPRMCPLASLRP